MYPAYFYSLFVITATPHSFHLRPWHWDIMMPTHDEIINLVWEFHNFIYRGRWPQKCLYFGAKISLFLFPCSNCPPFMFVWFEMICFRQMSLQSINSHDNLTFLAFCCIFLQITKVPVEECEGYTTFEECVGVGGGIGDPYCGWCTLYQRWDLGAALKQWL